jgi:hypothetical protein
MNQTEKTFRTLDVISKKYNAPFVTIDKEFIENGFIVIWFNKIQTTINVKDVDKPFISKMFKIVCSDKIVKDIINFIKEN